MSPARFRVLISGRRFGKTHLAIRELARFARHPGKMCWYIAPTYRMAKQIAWQLLKNKLIQFRWVSRFNESDLTAYLKNGSIISLRGADKYDSLRGVGLDFIVMDEFADIKNEAWTEVIRPTLSDTGGAALFCGSPKGFNWAYDLYQRGQVQEDNWRSWQFTTLDGGNVPPEEVEEAKRDLDPKTFRQEYLGTFETYAGLVYGDYSDHNHADCRFDPLKPIIWTHDFNYTPLSSAILQLDGAKIYAVDEIILESAIARQAAIEFVGRYGQHAEKTPVRIYGDASGHQGEKHGHKSDYIEIEQVLRKAGFKVEMRVPRNNPAIRDGQNSLRGKILNAKGERHLFVNPRKCKYIDKGLKTTQLMEGSTFQEKDSQYQHITTALRYFTHYEFPISGRDGGPVYAKW